MRGPFALLIMAPLIYGVFYPQPYLGQILRKIPIAVVDNDLSDLSHSIVQTLEASGAVSVAVRADTLAEAHAAVDRGEAFAVVGIPPGTERDLLKGTALTFRSTLMPPTFSSSGPLRMASRRRLLRSHPSSRRAARAPMAVWSGDARRREPDRHPAAADLQPGRRLCELYRAGDLAADPAADAPDRRRGVERPGRGAGGRSAFANVLGRGVAHLTLYLTPLALYLVVLPRVYGFSALATRCSCSRSPRCSFSQRASWPGGRGWFKRPETATLIFLGTSLPQLFLTGFSWPREGIPKPVLAVGTIFPSDFAIDGLVRINQLGASLWEVARDWRGLWILALVYFALAVMSAALVRRRHAHG